MTTGRANPGCCSSQTRAVFAGGYPGVNDQIDFVTISSTGNAVDWGVNLDTSRRYLMGCGNQTSGIFGGGGTPGTTNVIQYITIAQTAQTRNDFGDLTVDNMVNAGACSNSIKGVFIDGNSITAGRQIQAVNIASTGNAQNFGDVVNTGDASRSCANTVRGLVAGAGGVTL